MEPVSAGNDDHDCDYHDLRDPKITDKRRFNKGGAMLIREKISILRSTSSQSTFVINRSVRGSIVEVAVCMCHASAAIKNAAGQKMATN